MAAHTSAPSNPLITTKAPEAALSVQLHPLVLLTITDYITRHTSRQQQGPIIGAIIGQQNGRNFTLEHAYECKTVPADDGVVLDQAWFEERLEQYRDVHKAPALDLAGTFMLGPVAGPGATHLGFVEQVQKLTSSDSTMLLLFHPELVDQLQGGKLPITLYESVKEQEAAGAEAEIKFRQLSFEVETGEAEMIGVDFVATGAGVATAVSKVDTSPAAASTSATASEASTSQKKTTKGKGKAKDEQDTNGTTSSSTVLSPEDEELISTLTAKSNAIKMLNTRLQLIKSYLQTQPPSYFTDASLVDQPPQPETNHTLLRSINAMLSRLPLLTPPTAASAAGPDATDTGISKETQDVHLTTLLASLTRSVSEAQTMGGKYAVFSREKSNKERNRGGGGGARMGFGDESSLLNHSNGGDGF